MAKNYYEILGVTKTASKDEIKRAYRKLAHQYHPDKQGGGDEQKFREASEAYNILSDDTKRAQYDQFGQTFNQTSSGQGGFSGHEGFSDFMRGFGGGQASNMDFDFGDIFSDLFGGGRGNKGATHGVDLEMSLKISFMDSVFGLEKEVMIDRQDMCEVCQSSGAEKGSKVISCLVCHGTGQIITRKQTILGSIQHAGTCQRCMGTGKIPEKTCMSCRGSGVKKQSKKVKINIPGGISSGQRLRLSGEGERGYRGSMPGDLYVMIEVAPHQEFRRDGFDIITEVPVSFYQAALGANIEMETVDGKVTLTVPASTQSGKVLRLKHKGVPRLNGNGRGDHLAVIRVITPKKLTKKERELFKDLATESGESVNIDKSFWQKIRDTF